MKPISSIAVFMVCVLAAGCSAGITRQDYAAAEFLHDEAFPRSDEYVIETPQEIYALDSDVRAHMDTKIRSVADPGKRGEVLLDEIFEQAALNLSYDRGANTTASQTFHGRAANCLSLSILAYSMAKYTGFEPAFHEVAIPEFWERRSNYSVLNRHVNVRFKAINETTAFTLIEPELEIDFQPLGGTRRPPTRPIQQSRVTAMFYNNKAIDALFVGQHDLAYAYLKAALEQDSTLGMALANIGLLYARNGHLSWAEESLRRAIEIDPESTAPGENLIALLRMTGRADEARVIVAEIEARRASNPYYVHMQGEHAYDNGDWQEAIRLYRKAIAMKADVDLFHFDLAKAYFMAGDLDQARIYLQRAESRATSGDLKEKYRGKLRVLSGM